MKRRDLWYKNAIIYCLDVETYMDSNGDGIGDFEGLISRLDQLAALGVTCIWLLPFFPSPNRDNGYDVMDYYGVDPRLGTLGDFVEFVHQAHLYGIRVIIDLVVNHTSIEHPWFQEARADENSKYRNYYVWSKEKPANADEGVIFPGVQDSTWTYDRKAQQYYFHRFYKHQADLNIANPEVREEIKKVMGFWLQLGVSGFRVDAAPFLIELKGIEDHGIKDPYAFLQDFRQFLQWRKGDAIILAEANIAPEKVPLYFGDGDKLHMIFHFYANQHLWLALADGQPKHLVEALNAPPEIPQTAQWAMFLRNHDELDLGRLSEKERQLAFEKFGPSKTMQLYERGIRRRLPPMLDGDRRCIELAYSMMFTLPGTPVIWYGEEIGMGDDLSLEERNSVRTPMQWANDKNGGFSNADPKSLIRPVIDEGEYGYQHVNFEDASRDEHSLLKWFENAIRTRKQCPEFGYGTWAIMDAGDPAVFMHRCEWDGEVVLALHNFADRPIKVTIDLSELEQPVHHLVDLLGNDRHSIEDNQHILTLAPYGYHWLRAIMK